MRGFKNVGDEDICRRVERYYYGRTEALVKCGMAEAELEYGYSHLAQHEMHYQTARYNIFKFLIQNGGRQNEMVRDYNFFVGEEWLEYLNTVYEANVRFYKGEMLNDDQKKRNAPQWSFIHE